jgi:hypothetical protein
VYSSRRFRLCASTTQVLAWAVLLVLSLGLQRLLVVCTGPDCDHQVEFVHASGTCCDHAPAKHCCAADDRGETAVAGHGGCVDVALDSELGPVPQRTTFAPPSAPCLAATIDLPATAPRAHATAVLPYCTGPPRPDRRTELIASTLLLL